MKKWDSMPTAIARKMLEAGDDRSAVVEKTGLTMQSVRAIASKMRKSGASVPSEQKRYEYTGVNDSNQVVTFRSLQQGLSMGFYGEYVSACVNGKKDSYAGYKWTRKEI